MSDLNYEELNEKEKEVYDNAYNWGWSSAAYTQEDTDNLKPYVKINTEKLFWKHKAIFQTGYEEGFLKYQTQKTI